MNFKIIKRIRLGESFDHRMYDDYLKKHISAVQKCYEILVEHGIFIEDKQIKKQISEHDKSKYDKEEYDAYGEYFYGKSKSKADTNFDYAWLRHQHLNPHHWQHWLLKEDDTDKVRALDMPDNYIQEMICDWMAFSLIKKDMKELFTWYNEYKKNQVLSENTKKKVEEYLDNIKLAKIDLAQYAIEEE